MEKKLIDALARVSLFIIIPLLLLIAAAPNARSGEADDKLLIEYKDNLLTLIVTDATLTDVLKEIEDKTGVKITSHDLSKEKITLEFHALPLDEGIRKVIGPHNNSIFLYEEKKGEYDRPSLSRLTEVRIFPVEEGMSAGPETVKTAPPPVSDNTDEPVAAPEEPQFNVLYRNILEGKEPEVREDAVEKIAGMEGPEVLGVLLMAMEDEDGDVRASAAEALGARRSKEAFEPLIKALTDKDPWVRESAADALGNLGDPRAITHLKTVLENKDEDEDVLESTETSLKLLEAME